MYDQTPRPQKASLCTSFCVKAAGTAFAVALTLFIGIYATVLLAEKERPWETRQSAQAKNLYESKIIPSLQQVMDKFPEYAGPSAAQTAAYLRQAGFAPQAYKRLRSAILSAKDGNALNAALKDAKDFAQMASRIAGKLQQRPCGAVEKSDEEAMGKAALITAALLETKVPLQRARPHLDRLAKLTNNPEALRAAVSLLQKKNAAPELTAFLLDKLAVSPEKAFTDIANIEKTGKNNKRFRFAMDMEGSCDIIKLPLAGIAPDAAKTLAKNKTIPLYVSSFKRTDKLLQIRRIEAPLWADENNEQSGNEKRITLNPGERLYTLGRGTNFVLEGSLLDTLAPSGPIFTEHANDAKKISGFFSREPRFRHPREKYVIAAACGPEELRAHLASLMVVRSEREKSLYGPFDDFTWKENDARQRGIPLDVIVRDVPGMADRLADIRDADFFLSLAPLADKEGLARLMGPIRGIWALNRPGETTPWEELRYTPGGKPEHSVLGQAPLLQLDKNALESILARKRTSVTHAWASFLLRKELGKEPGRETGGNKKAEFAAGLPEMTRKTAARFDELAKKGFVSPLDMIQTELYLRKAGNDAMLRETLMTIRDDASLSSARRVRAMRAALGER